jgi:hypothetical protein
LEKKEVGDGDGDHERRGVIASVESISREKRA